MNENILVTGGAGFIGSHLVDKLLAQGDNVRVLDILEPQVHGELASLGRWPDYCNDGAEYVLGDVRDPDVVRKALADVDVVFHFAAMVGVGQSMYEVQKYTDVNINGTAVLLDAIVNDEKIRGQVRKIVVASSMSNYGEGEYACPVHGRVSPQTRPVNQLVAHEWELRCTELVNSHPCHEILQPVPTRETKPLHTTSIYAIAKKTQEEMCLAIGAAYDIPAVALRFFNTYGTRQALSNPYTGVAAIFSSRLLNNNPPMIFEDGKQIRDFVHVDDIVQGNLIAMKETTESGVYNVGSGSPITILEVAQTLATHLDVPELPIIKQQYRAGDIRHCYADITKMKQLGYVPQVSFVAGVSDLVQWVLRQQSDDLFEQADDLLEKKGLTI